MRGVGVMVLEASQRREASGQGSHGAGLVQRAEFQQGSRDQKDGWEGCLDKPGGGSDGAGRTATPSALTL